MELNIGEKFRLVLKAILIFFVVSMLMGFMTLTSIYSSGIPNLRAESIEEGYVIPNQFRVLNQNLNEPDSRHETYVRYKGKSYLLKENEKGEPYTCTYERKIRPSRKAEPAQSRIRSLRTIRHH